MRKNGNNGQASPLGGATLCYACSSWCNHFGLLITGGEASLACLSLIRREDLGTCRTGGIDAQKEHLVSQQDGCPCAAAMFFQQKRCKRPTAALASLPIILKCPTTFALGFFCQKKRQDWSKMQQHDIIQTLNIL